MSITVTPKLEALIQNKIDTGLYSDVEEVLSEALQLLDQRDRLERLRASLAEADEQIDRGEGTPFTDERFDQIRLNARMKFEAGHQPNPDVCP
ncbi:MAG: antitoxin ParD1/3/4 [Thermomicrobiales bacterium]|jgi:antitoxin ParD1/3/4|nr:antitoxin ParD1/3/4 [Thermomicrobiales bacterium]